MNKKFESHLIENGIDNWDTFLKSDIPFISKERKKAVDAQIQKAARNLAVKNHHYFSTILPDNEHWRLYNYFEDSCAYVDIETTGLSKYSNRITTISLFNGKEVKTWISGQNLDHESLEEEFAKYKMLVTFNGKLFDVPFIKHKFPKLDFDHIHLDLRWVGRLAGFSGGLKKIEQETGIDRGELNGITGKDAVRLWKQYERGDEEALDLLVKYNQEDVINLKTLSEIIVGKLANGSGTN
jgi:uncharacterized protein